MADPGKNGSQYLYWAGMHPRAIRSPKMNITKTCGRVRAHLFSHLLLQVTDYMLGHVIIEKILTKKETYFKSMFKFLVRYGFGIFSPVGLAPGFLVQNHRTGLPVLLHHTGPGCALETRRYRRALNSSYFIILIFQINPRKKHVSQLR